MLTGTQHNNKPKALVIIQNITKKLVNSILTIHPSFLYEARKFKKQSLFWKLRSSE